MTKNILPNEILRKKRFGGELNEAEIRAFVRGVTDKSWADYQISALLMAICIHGMSDRETLALTLAMAKSGDTLDLKDIPGVKADKHSTGGVGDTTSLILVPLTAACGLKVAKMSGRGLGFTGGTLDKLESIPGMRVNLEVDEFKSIVRSVGCAIAGQTAELAPADKVLYALRDVTETVDCLPLVVSSILSKKLAAGCDVVVLDVKTGSGAIMDTPEKSRKLAEDMVRIGNLSGRRFSALITDMDQPLGMYIGNALEVEEAIDVLAGRAAGPLRDVALTLGAHMLKNAGLVPSVDAGEAMLAEKIESGAGLAKFAEMIRAQGGDPRVCEDTGLLPKASRKVPMYAMGDGYISAIRTSEVGNAARLLGAGRLRKEDGIDPAVGIVMQRRVGEYVRRGDPLLTIHANAHSDVTGAHTLLSRAFKLSPDPVTPPELIHAVVE